MTRPPRRTSARPSRPSRRYYADNGTYVGMTLASLQAIDTGLELEPRWHGDGQHLLHPRRRSTASSGTRPGLQQESPPAPARSSRTAEALAERHGATAPLAVPGSTDSGEHVPSLTPAG